MRAPRPLLSVAGDRLGPQVLTALAALAALVGWLAFGEALVPLDVLGMVLVGTALVMARTRRQPRLR